jgi:hypothetical protein
MAFKSRLSRLEVTLGIKDSEPARFPDWQAIFGGVPLDQLDPASRELAQQIRGPRRPYVDPLEEEIRAVEQAGERTANSCMKPSA